MKFTKTTVTSGVNILANDHFVGIPYNCKDLASLATGNVIPAGTIIPANDATAIGVLLNDVKLDENPNGTIVIHGFIRTEKLPVAPTDAVKTALKGITFLNASGIPADSKLTVTYDANGGTGTVTDSSSPYNYGAEVTVQAGTSLTGPDSKTFQGWALTDDAAAKNDAYDPSDKFNITENMTFYAVWA